MKTFFTYLLVLFVASAGVLLAQAPETEAAALGSEPAVEAPASLASLEEAGASAQEDHSDAQIVDFGQLSPETQQMSGRYACRVACWNDFTDCGQACTPGDAACLQQCADARRSCLDGC